MRDFLHDVNDRPNVLAEELVGAWLRRSYGGAVADARREHGPYDYSLHLTYDVKCSKWLAREGRIHYEYEHAYPGGHSKPGWSTKQELQYVVYVNPETWEAHLIRMKFWRAHVEDRLWHAQEQGRDTPSGWIHSESRNREYVTRSWSMPLDELREVERVVVRSFRLHPPTEGAA